MAYSSVSVTGYNANPPSDDGSATSANEISWQKHIDKIGSPLKTALESINTNMLAFSAESFAGQAGTKTIVHQATAPTGWTTVTDHNNKALRLVNSSPGTGGTANFTDVFKARTITQANLPSVNLPAGVTGSIPQYDTFKQVAGLAPATGNEIWYGIENRSIAGLLSVSVPLGGSGTAMDFDVKYVDVIEVSKD